jgi:hypothetical protein
MPLYFIPNEGQVDARVAFYIQGKDKSISFSSDGLTYVLTGKDRADNPSRFAVKLDLVGAATNIRPAGAEKAETVISYFKGKPEEWKAGLPTYSRIVYRDLWPGIDLSYYGTVDKLKYEFLVHPGADPSKIRLAYRGAEAVEVNDDGRLEIMTPAGGFEDEEPTGYQEIDGAPAAVSIRYRLEESNSEAFSYGFEVADYDRSRPLVIDPAVLVYCGFIGGSAADNGAAIAVDSSGNAYVTGDTQSTETTFPVVVGPDLTVSARDAFVAKVNASGTGLVYCGFIGGSSYDYGHAIAVDDEGNAYIGGSTGSNQSSFPVSVGPDLTFNSGTYDAFVAKVDASGTALLYCGYVGGSSQDRAFDIDVDDSRNAYLAGETSSTEATFPVSVGPDLTYNSGGDVFVAKVNVSGATLAYCGYIGGSGDEMGFGSIAVDDSGNAYVAGQTMSNETTFPVTVGPDLTYNGGTRDAFVAKVYASGASLAYCGYVGGSGGEEYIRGIAVDGAGQAYVAGNTNSETTFPVAVGPDLTYNGGVYDVFVGKLNASGTGFLYCGFIGGSDNDICRSVALDASRNVYLAGHTKSSEATFPVVGGPDLTFNGLTDAFVAKLNSAGTTLLYCGYIGGAGYDDFALSNAVDNSGNAYITGQTYSPQSVFPVTAGPDLTHNGGLDAFVAKISSLQKDDLLGTWAGQGVYYRNSDTGQWVQLASAATKIAAGSLDGDEIDDLIGIWPTQGGVWVRYGGDGSWALLSSTADWIEAGDMNGDGRDDLLGAWDSQGVYYRDSDTGLWVQLASPATKIVAGDIDNDGTDDLIGIWPTQGGVWIKYSDDGSWENLSSTADWIAAGDMNGDGRDDLLGAWASQGVYYRNSANGQWVLMASPASVVTTGDLDADGIDDLIGIWPTQGGVWVKYGGDDSWALLSSTADWIATGKMRAAGSLSLDEPKEWPSPERKSQNVAAERKLGGPPKNSATGPGASDFAFSRQSNLVPRSGLSSLTTRPRPPGPGEPGFRCVVQENLFPRLDK